MNVMDFLYAVQKSLWRAIRPRTKGVKILLINENGEIVLIRNTYGRSDLLMLPGGGIRPLEPPERAAVREIREELGCEVKGLTYLSHYSSEAEGKRDTIHLFKGFIDGQPRADRREILEARLIPLDGLPDETSPATRRRIEEYLGRRPIEVAW